MTSVNYTVSTTWYGDCRIAFGNEKARSIHYLIKGQLDTPFSSEARQLRAAYIEASAIPVSRITKICRFFYEWLYRNYAFLPPITSKVEAILQSSATGALEAEGFYTCEDVTAMFYYLKDEQISGNDLLGVLFTTNPNLRNQLTEERTKEILRANPHLLREDDFPAPSPDTLRALTREEPYFFIKSFQNLNQYLPAELFAIAVENRHPLKPEASSEIHLHSNLPHYIPQYLAELGEEKGAEILSILREHYADILPQELQARPAAAVEEQEEPSPVEPPAQGWFSTEWLQNKLFDFDFGNVFD